MNVNLYNIHHCNQSYYRNIAVDNRSTMNFCGVSSSQCDVDKLYSIISKEQLEQEYKNICNNLKLDYDPKLEIVDSYSNGRGGGYNFYRHEVSLCASDLVCSDYKIVGNKAGKKVVLVDPGTMCPLFSTEEMAQEFVRNAKSRGNYGFDSIELVPTSLDDKKRLIIQKLSHELIHAQQHMFMRQTEGIDERTILKAWTHAKPKNKVEEMQLNESVEKSFKHSYWADKPKTQTKIFKDSPVGYLTQLWLNAVQNYPPVDSPEYLRNAIEVDAYRRSADYTRSIFGQLQV